MKKILLLIMLLFVANIGSARPLTTEDEVARGEIATWPASLAEKYAKERFPKADMVYLESIADMVQNLRQKKITAFAMNRIMVDDALSSGQGDMEILGNPLGKTGFCFVFTKSDKGKKLCEEFNAFLKENQKNGNLSAWQNKWFSGNANAKIDNIPLSGENGTISVMTNPVVPPLVYMQDNEIAGYEAELFRHFCAAYGYNYDMTVATFETGMAGITIGKFDMGFCAVELNSERQENFLFSDRNCETDCVIVVRSDSGENMGALLLIKEKFYNTFLVEDRWKLFATGLFTTMLIMFASVFFGTLLGFGECLLYRENNRRINAVLNFLSRLFAGMPVVVLLMIFYYMVFGSWDISGALVAIVAFSILFGFLVFEMLKNAADNIPKGQTEGALALGFSERQAFLRFILPQAVQSAFPTYQGEIIGLLKATAIVGYIAVEDLTKMADIIRAQTFDAFAPLIVITILYLAFVWLLQKITNRILANLDPKRRTKEKILRGVTL